MPVVVSDTSPLRALHHIGRLDLVPELFGEVLIPPAVASELAKPDSLLVPIDVKTLPVTVRMTGRNDLVAIFRTQDELDPGESEALALAIEVGAEEIIIDERRGRTAAARHGLKPVGLLGTLLRAKQRGFVSHIRPLLDQLQTQLRFRVSPELRSYVLLLAGENGS